MRTFIAVVLGLAVAALLVFLGDSSFAQVTDTRITPGYAGTSRWTELVALVWTFISISFGALTTVRVRPTSEAIGGFIVGELFFGVGLLHQFWHATTWYSAVAVLLVIPAALLGAWIGSQLRHAETATA